MKTGPGDGMVKGVLSVVLLLVLTTSDACRRDQTAPSAGDTPSPSSSRPEGPFPDNRRPKRVSDRYGLFSVGVPSNWGYERTKRRITLIAQQPASGTRIYIWRLENPDPPPLADFPELSLSNFDANRNPRVRGEPRFLRVEGVKAVSWDVVIEGRFNERFRYVDAIFKDYVIDIAYVPGVDATFSRELAILDRVLNSWRWRRRADTVIGRLIGAGYLYGNPTP